MAAAGRISRLWPAGVAGCCFTLQPAGVPGARHGFFARSMLPQHEADAVFADHDPRQPDPGHERRRRRGNAKQSVDAAGQDPGCE